MVEEGGMNICESGNEYEPWSSHEGTRGDGMEDPLASVSSTRGRT